MANQQMPVISLLHTVIAPTVAACHLQVEVSLSRSVPLNVIDSGWFRLVEDAQSPHTQIQHWEGLCTY